MPDPAPPIDILAIATERLQDANRRYRATMEDLQSEKAFRTCWNAGFELDLAAVDLDRVKRFGMEVADA